MIKKIQPKKITLKSKSYSAKPKVKVTRLDRNDLIYKENVKRVNTTMHELTDCEIMYQADDKRTKFRQVQCKSINGYITAYLMTFNEPSRYIVLCESEIETKIAKATKCKPFGKVTEKRVILNSMKFEIMNHKIIKPIEPTFDYEVTAIIKNNAVIGLYPAETAKDWERGIDLLEEFKRYDFTPGDQIPLIQSNNIPLSVSSAKKDIQTNTVLSNNRGLSYPDNFL